MIACTSPALARRTVCGWLLGAPCLPGVAAAKLPPAVWEPLPGLPDVALQDEQGRQLKLVGDILQNRVFVLNFIFTGCSTVCPPQTALLRQTRETMPSPSSPLVWLSLSVDPLGDSPAALLAYRRRFDIAAGPTPWHFLTGEPDAVAKLRAIWGDRSRVPNDHLSRLIVGSAASKRYTRMDAFTAPAVVAQRLQELMP